MTMLGIDINLIAELGTPVAQSGAIGVADRVADGAFDPIIAIAIIIAESGT